MKRDWGLIRDLLEHLESLGFGQHWEPRELPGHCREAVAYHLHRKHRPAAAGRKEARRCPTAKTRPQVRSRP